MNFSQAVEYYFSLIPKDVSGLYKGGEGLRRMQLLLEQLDNPQENFRSIHIAGTSGKGSTVSIISQILKSQGFLVGTMLSPHLVDIRERCMLDCRFINEAKFIENTHIIKTAVEKTALLTKQLGPPTYFEALVALAYYSFAKANVDYAVIETGLGGTYDGTNTIQRTDKLSVITRIGLDHTEILGETLELIAPHKAGIILPGSQVIALEQESEVNQAITSRAEELDAEVRFINKEQVLRSTTEGFNIEFDKLKLLHLKTNLLADYQQENIMMSLAALDYLSGRDKFLINEQSLRASLLTLNIPGRMDRLTYQGQEFIIDGAHNPQKMQAMIDSLTHLFPTEKFNFLIGFKAKKDFQAMLDLIIPHAEKIYICEFSVGSQDLKHKSTSSEEIGEYLTAQHFYNFHKFSDLDSALESLKNENIKKIVLTGSLYLASDFYQVARSQGSQ